MDERWRDLDDDHEEPKEPTRVTEREVPEADALEQSRDLREPRDQEPDAVGDRPEADALEQERAVDDEEDDERR